MSAIQEVQTFDLVIDRPITDDEIDALFEAGCDDCSPETGPQGTVLHFDRESPSLITAIVSAVNDVERTGLVVSGVGEPDIVTLPEIAVRTARSAESIRLLALGKRGPGNFPKPRDGFYSWSAVRVWFADYEPKAVDSPSTHDLLHDQIIRAADLVVRARTALRTVDAKGLEQLVSTAA